MQPIDDTGQVPLGGPAFRPGLVLGVFSLYEIQSQSQSLFTVVEGPNPDQVTQHWTSLVNTTLDSFMFSVSSSLIPQLDSDLHLATEQQPEGLRAVGRDVGASFEVTVEESRARVSVYPDIYSADNIIMTLIDAWSGRPIGTVTGRKLGAGFPWILVLVVVAVTIVVLDRQRQMHQQTLVAIQQYVPITTGTKVTLGGGMLPPLTFDGTTTVHKTSAESRPPASAGSISSWVILMGLLTTSVLLMKPFIPGVGKGQMSRVRAGVCETALAHCQGSD